MSAAWLTVLAVGAGTVVAKAAGPVFLGGRELPPRVLRLVQALAPALLAALVATQALGGERELVFDERLLGLAAAAVAVTFRAPLLATVIVAAAVTAFARGLT